MIVLLQITAAPDIQSIVGSIPKPKVKNILIITVLSKHNINIVLWCVLYKCTFQLSLLFSGTWCYKGVAEAHSFSGWSFCFACSGMYKHTSIISWVIVDGKKLALKPIDLQKNVCYNYRSNMHFTNYAKQFQYTCSYFFFCVIESWLATCSSTIKWSVRNSSCAVLHFYPVIHDWLMGEVTWGIETWGLYICVRAKSFSDNWVSSLLAAACITLTSPTSTYSSMVLSIEHFIHYYSDFFVSKRSVKWCNCLVIGLFPPPLSLEFDFDHCTVSDSACDAHVHEPDQDIFVRFPKFWYSNRPYNVQSI